VHHYERQLEVGDFRFAPGYSCAWVLGLVHMGSGFPLTGYSILVVEDEPLVGLDLADMLNAAGARVVCIKSAGEAISSLDRFRVAAAVLDINLGNHDCSAVCQGFREREIPFVFYTGYGVALDGWATVPVIRKPAMPQEVLAAVERLCASRQQTA
jgi:DNA-binding response OmpR family regulator